MMEVKFIVGTVKCHGDHFIFQVDSIESGLEWFKKRFKESWLSSEVVNALWISIDGGPEECVYAYYVAGLVEKNDPEMITIDKYHLASFFFSNVKHYEQLSLFDEPYWGYIK